MSNLRVPFAVVGGVLFSSAAFLALFQFISAPLDIDPIKATVIEFTRQRIDTPVESTRDPRIERPPPVVVPTQSQTIVDDFGFQDHVTLVRPTIERLPPDHGGTVGVDRDVIPVVRFPPEYPPRAIPRGIEGWVQIQFTVTAAGTVRDPIVVAAEPKGIFEEAALNAIARWRYNPRVDGGVAVERVGLQAVIRFQLNN